MDDGYSYVTGVYADIGCFGKDVMRLREAMCVAVWGHELNMTCAPCDHWVMCLQPG